jgi:hypothetical protein
MAEGPDKNREIWNRSTGGAFRALAESAPAEPADGWGRTPAEIAEERQNLQVARRRDGYAGAVKQLARDREGYQSPSFDDAHPYAREAAALAVSRTAPAKRGQVTAKVTSAHGESEEPVHVTAFADGLAWVEGDSYAIAAAFPQLLGDPSARASASPADWRADLAPVYPGTPRGREAEQSWQDRLQDTPGGRQAARREAAALWAETGQEPPDPAQGIWPVQYVAG